MTLSISTINLFDLIRLTMQVRGEICGRLATQIAIYAVSVLIFPGHMSTHNLERCLVSRSTWADEAEGEAGVLTYI